jgi:hypothetical protein
MKRKYTWLWVIWLGLFLAIELPAIFNDEQGDTLSEHVWAVTDISFFWWLFAGFVIWFGAHLLGPKASKWFRKWRKRNYV